MLKEILALSGKPGLYKLVSKGPNFSIVESLTDKKRIPAYMRDKPNALGDTLMYTTEGDVPLGDVLTAIKEKEERKPVSIDLSKADGNELRAYFAEVQPNYDPDRVYPNDIKKALKWYNILIDCGITDFSTKEEEEAGVEEVKEEAEASEEEKEAQKTTAQASVSHTAKPASTKQKGVMAPAKSVKTAKSKPMNVIQKKSIVGSKRGS